LERWKIPLKQQKKTEEEKRKIEELRAAEEEIQRRIDEENSRDHQNEQESKPQFNDGDVPLASRGNKKSKQLNQKICS